MYREENTYISVVQYRNIIVTRTYRPGSLTPGISKFRVKFKFTTVWNSAR